MKRQLLLAASLTLAACADRSATQYPATPTPERACDPSGLVSFAGDVAIERFVGEQATAELGAQMLEATGAHILRWVPPRTAVTMDFRADRLTVSYDDAMMIIRASCG